MASNNIIQRILAAVVLLIFSFSITPKQYLHDAIAHHHDKAVHLGSYHGKEFSNTGFVCKCDNLVAESPFTDAITRVHFVTAWVFSIQREVVALRIFKAAIFSTCLRGPPSFEQNHSLYAKLPHLLR